MKVLICEDADGLPALVITNVIDLGKDIENIKLYFNGNTFGYKGEATKYARKVLGEIDLGDFVTLIVEGYKEGMNK